LKSAPQYSRFLPGSAPPSAAPQIYRTAPRPGAAAGVMSAGQNAARLTSISAEQAMAQGILFAGNPDSVYKQVMEFYDKVGGFGHLSLVGRSGFMTHAESEKSIRLFSTEVLPRLREIKPVTAEGQKPEIEFDMPTVNVLTIQHLGPGDRGKIDAGRVANRLTDAG